MAGGRTDGRKPCGRADGTDGSGLGSLAAAARLVRGRPYLMGRPRLPSLRDLSRVWSLALMSIGNAKRGLKY